MRKGFVETVLQSAIEGCVVVMVAMALWSAACTLPGGGDETVIVNTATNNAGSTPLPAPGASPSPAAGPIDHVKVTQFGESCGEKGRNITVGCTKFLTCTPFFADGTLVPPAVHGPSPEFFGVIEGQNFVQVTTPEETFNRDVKGLFPGIVAFECVVKGVSSGRSEFVVVPAS